MNRTYMHAPRGIASSQRGYSLVELSVATVIALFLLAGLLTVVQSTRKTFGTQNDLSLLQDQQRLAMTLITDVIQEAGYYPDPITNKATDVFPIASPFTQAGQAIYGTAPGTAQGDTITVRYATAGADDVMDCRGNTNTTALATPLAYVNFFSVKTNAAGVSELVCSIDGGATTVPLVSGVQSMQILYGVKTDFAVDDNRLDSYLKASEMTAANWANVISVRVTLNFKNPLYGQPGQTDPSQATIPFTRVITVMNKGGVKT